MFHWFNNLRTKFKVGVGMAVPLSLVVIVGAIGYLSINKIVGTSKWVNHTQDVLAEAKAQNAFDAETLSEVESFLNAPREWQEARQKG